MTGFLRIAKLDFFTMKAQFIAYLSLVAMVLLFGFIGSPVIVLYITGAWFLALMSSNIFAIQEKNNLDRLYGSLSVSLNDIVLGRYLFMFLNYLVTFIAVSIMNFGFALYRNTTFDAFDIMFGFSVSFLVFSAITGIQMPLFFKMSYTKAKVWSLIPFIAVMLSFVAALSGIVELMRLHTGALIVGGMLASCIIQFISYHIAVILYRKRK